MRKMQVSGPVCLKNKTAIVTGAAQGIGQAVCLALAREGAMVVACDVKSCDDTIGGMRNMGQKSLGILCDVSNKNDVQKTVEQVKTEYGRIDILVSNAAILGDYGKPYEEYTLTEWDNILNVNLKGAFLMTQAVWPHMREQGEGKIVCIGSVAGKMGGIFAGPHYCSSKGGIHALVKWGARHGAVQGIYFNGVAPGPIATAMTENEPLIRDEIVPLGRLGRPEDIAEAVVFLSSPASNFITGIVLDVNGGVLMS